MGGLVHRQLGVWHKELEPSPSLVPLPPSHSVVHLSRTGTAEYASPPNNSLSLCVQSLTLYYSEVQQLPICITNLQSLKLLVWHTEKTPLDTPNLVELLGKVDGLLSVSSVLELVEQLNHHFSSEWPHESFVVDSLHQTHIERAVRPAPHTISSGTHTQTHPITSRVAVEWPRDPPVVQFESAVKITHPEHNRRHLNSALQPLHVLHSQLEVAVSSRFLVFVHLPTYQTDAATEPVVGAVSQLMGAGEKVVV